mmetsp:Transcript_3124/g.4773  ORF Transcript_3124/g.4773 Transcript_3124/m.4773 type:complete len:106 (+) Transcript_3124:717-1034(+)
MQQYHEALKAIDHPDSELIFLGGVGAIFILLILICCCFCRCLKKRKDRRILTMTAEAATAKADDISDNFSGTLELQSVHDSEAANDQTDAKILHQTKSMRQEELT